MTPHLQLVPRSRKRGFIHPLPYAFRAYYLVKPRDKFTFTNYYLISNNRNDDFRCADYEDHGFWGVLTLCSSGRVSTFRR
jgi:hypothetical protein